MVSLTTTDYQRRRQALLKQLPADSIAVIAAASEVTRSRDTEFPFRQNSDFFYLTGFNEPDALLVLAPQANTPVTLFCQPSDADAEVWHGRRLGVDAALDKLGVDAAYSTDTIDEHLFELLNGVHTVFSCHGDNAELDQLLWQLSDGLRQTPKKGNKAPQQFSDLRPLLHEMRLIKSAKELDIMRRAASITVAAFKRAMHYAQVGRYEYQVAAELHHEFASQGALHPAYGTICGGGDNACILHYTENSAELRDGDLLLIDAGAEYQGYAADITRTFPVNGRFSEPQKQLYELVLKAQQAAFDEVKPGSNLIAAQQAAAKVITQGLLELGILSGTFDDNWRKSTWKRFFIHGLGHWLGLDVHDVGEYQRQGQPRPFQAGMVLTIEPGIYIPLQAEVDGVAVDKKWCGIGIRIEDDLIVTADGYENMTAAVSKTVAEVEQWLAQRG
ncbi:Xaa-Pro aminopeptidase [Idiomarina xiamenensis]|uniref:Xaa-Pro aminopeptidase n=1 Tax=Idiomarina xiamenensis 10-D-4 TaxID=740709 RepID=K2JW81_9GAMM|nr:Xaa-Pro aminopeptidase [Idiomarina xiamenensis]EKE87636.1 Xaa-Pro aminopeptidase [Idiomarina xiamenensis 10-D-4]